jgi:hypothetical protein
MSAVAFDAIAGLGGGNRAAVGEDGGPPAGGFGDCEELLLLLIR